MRNRKNKIKKYTLSLLNTHSQTEDIERDMSLRSFETMLGSEL